MFLFIGRQLSQSIVSVDLDMRCTSKPAVNPQMWVLPVCPVADGGQCAASRCDGAWIPLRINLSFFQGFTTAVAGEKHHFNKFV